MNDRVTARGETYKITRIEFYPWRRDGRPWLSGVAKTKRGEWSKNIRNLYGNWTKP